MPAQTARRTHGAARTAAGRGGTIAPRHHRRVSGPARPLRPAPAGAPRTAAAPRALPRQGTSTFERLTRVADHRLVDGLLRSRAWIVIVGVLLGGIVAMQVSLLKLNSGITRAVQASATLERQNANMEDRIARLSSGQRVAAAARAKGMVFPPAGEVGYLTAHGARDAQLAAKRATAPSAEAAAVMASGGHGTAAGTTATAPAATATAAPATTATTPPVSTTATTPASSATTAPASSTAAAPPATATTAAAGTAATTATAAGD